MKECFGRLFVWQYSNKIIEEPILRIKDLIEAEPEVERPLEQLSKQAFLSKYHFIRIFKEKVGLTPHLFQMQNRIRRAKQRIRSGQSLTAVAQESGFFDQSHFVKWFKRMTTMTPKEYQRMINKGLG